MQLIRGFYALLAGAFLFGCTTAPVPVETLSRTSASIQAAEALSAGQYPEGALLLKRAHDQTAEAQALIDAGETERAKMALLRAERDAELAALIVQREDARKRENEARVRLDELRKEGAEHETQSFPADSSHPQSDRLIE